LYQRKAGTFLGALALAVSLFVGPAAAQNGPLAQATPPTKVDSNAKPPSEGFLKRFPVQKINVTGASAVSSEEIRAIVAPHEARSSPWTI